LPRLYTEIYMALQIRRGTDTQRQNTVFAQAEMVYTTDLKDLWVGDGVTSGGTQIAPVKSVNGLTGTVALTTDSITQGSTNKYYSSASAKVDVAAALTAGNATNTGITFSYNAGVINAVVSTTGTLAAVVNDTNPSLGGNLSLNNKNIGGTGNISITGSVTGSANVVATSGYLQSGVLRLTSNRLTTTDSSTFEISAPIKLDGADLGSGYINVVNNSTVNSMMDLENHNTSSSGGVWTMNRSRGTQNVPVRLQDQDTIFNMLFVGTAPSEYAIAAAISASVSGTTSAGVVPGKLTFSVANSSGTLINPLAVDSSGAVTASYAFGTGSSSQALANAGAASLTNVATYFTTTTASTGTLAAGVEGQIKTFAANDISLGNMVITVTNAGWKSSGTGTITFSTRGAACTLQYINAKWFAVGNNGAVFA